MRKIFSTTKIECTIVKCSSNRSFVRHRVTTLEMEILVRMRRFAKHSKLKCSVVIFENLEIKERDGVVLL